VICDFGAETISDFCEELNSCDHVEVVEVNTDRPSGDLVPGASSFSTRTSSRERARTNPAGATEMNVENIRALAAHLRLAG